MLEGAWFSKVKKNPCAFVSSGYNDSIDLNHIARLLFLIILGNPYYIVQQGKVNALCTMSSADRLELRKEVAGCTVYDEKRTDSLKQMEENRQIKVIFYLASL